MSVKSVLIFSANNHIQGCALTSIGVVEDTPTHITDYEL